MTTGPPRLGRGLRPKGAPAPDRQLPDCYAVVEPGSALDCCGHDILVPEAEIVDVDEAL